MTSDEISPDDFYKLEQKTDIMKSRSSEELLERLLSSSLTTIAVAKFLGVSKEAAYSRLRNLQKKGLVEERFQGKKAYWFNVSNKQK